MYDPMQHVKRAKHVLNEGLDYTPSSSRVASYSFNSRVSSFNSRPIYDDMSISDYLFLFTGKYFISSFNIYNW
jgi:hypothetical protein